VNTLIVGVCGALAWTLATTVELGLTRPRRIAHEAGHALLAWRSRYSVVEHVTSVSNIITHGGYMQRQRIETSSFECAFDSAVISMGGLAGEMIMFGKFKTAHGKSDIEGAQKVLLRGLPPSKVKPVVIVAFKTACRRLVADKAAFLTLQRALDQHDFLSPAQIEAAIGPPRLRSFDPVPVRKLDAVRRAG
jgi:hypothetical protein